MSGKRNPTGAAPVNSAASPAPAGLASGASGSTPEVMEVEAEGTPTPGLTVSRPAAGPSALSDASVPSIQVVAATAQADDTLLLSSRGSTPTILSSGTHVDLANLAAQVEHLKQQLAAATQAATPQPAPAGNGGRGGAAGGRGQRGRGGAMRWRGTSTGKGRGGGRCVTPAVPPVAAGAGAGTAGPLQGPPRLLKTLQSRLSSE